MSSDISAEHEQFIQGEIAAGVFQDRSEALDAAVELLRRRRQLIRDVNAGIDQLEDGRRVSLDPDRIKATIRQRLHAEGHDV
jgi:Arc/MetJ-type ribon-helix-helix transcriptional regulator